MPESFPLARIEAWAARIFSENGASDASAASVARNLVAAEADGLKGHGLGRVPDLSRHAPGRQDRRPRRAGRDRARAPACSPSTRGRLRLSRARPRASPNCRPSPGRRAWPPRLYALEPFRRRRPPCGAARRRRAGGAALRQHAQGDRALGRRSGRVRHQPDRFRCAAEKREPRRRGHGAEQGGARQDPTAGQKGEPIPAEWAVDEEGKPTTDPPPRSRARCSRWAAPRARPWR